MLSFSRFFRAQAITAESRRLGREDHQTAWDRGFDRELLNLQRDVNM